jgi:hypothetical protein
MMITVRQSTPELESHGPAILKFAAREFKSSGEVLMWAEPTALLNHDKLQIVSRIKKILPFDHQIATDDAILCAYRGYFCHGSGSVGIGCR